MVPLLSHPMWGVGMETFGKLSYTFHLLSHPMRGAGMETYREKQYEMPDGVTPQLSATIKNTLKPRCFFHILSNRQVTHFGAFSNHFFKYNTASAGVAQ